MKNIPKEFQMDIEKAKQILKKHGCTKLYLFGSLVEDHATSNSDIDLAVENCPEGKYFEILGELLMGLDHSVDLINLDNKDAFSQYLKNENELILVA